MNPVLARVAWGVFFGGVAVVLWGLATLSAIGFPKAHIRGLLLIVMPLCVALASGFTFAASRGFSRRRNVLRSWFDECLLVASTPSEENEYKQWHVDQDMNHVSFSVRSDSGALHWRLGPSLSPQNTQVFAEGALRPAPWHANASQLLLSFPYAEYVDLLDAEVRSARFYAARIAAALAGVFIMSIQVYARLV